MNIHNPFRRTPKITDLTPEEQAERLPTALDVWQSPAIYNRATRRRAGLFGRFWRWDLNATKETRREFMPRYIRRHFDSDKFLHPSTRRQRRHRAVILRITGRTGVGR